MAGNQVVISVIGENAQLRKALSDSERRVKGLEKTVNRGKRSWGDAFSPLKKSAVGAAGPVGGLGGKFGAIGGAAAGMSGPMAAAAAGIAGVAMAVDLVGDSLDALKGLTKETKKLSRETGMSKEMSSAWIGVGERVGVSAGQLSTSFGMLSKKIKASQGDTKAADSALKQLASAGISQAALKSGDMNRVLLETAERFKNMKDGPEKTALSMQLFGRSGKALLPILNKGKGGVTELQKEMKALGLTVGDKTEKNVTKLGQSQKTLSQIFKGAKILLATAVIPVLARFASGFTDGVKALRMGQKPTTDIGRKMVSLAGFIKSLTPVLNFFKAIIGQTFKYAGAIVGAISAVIQGKWGKAWRYIKQAAGTLFGIVTAPFRAMLRFLGGVVGSIGRLGGRIGNALKNGVMSALRGIAGLVKGTFNGIAGAIKGTINSVIDLANSGIRKVNSVTSKIGIGQIGEIPKLAKGGIVTRPTIALIGEAGPEAVVPLSKARGAGMGQTVFNIHNYGSSVDEQSLSAKIGWQLATRGIA